MILYKYLPLEAALAMIETQTLGFTKTSGLNDPSETTAAAHPGEKKSFWGAFDRRQHVETSYAILTLTRNPLSPVMWSHYAKGHTGLVIGIDSRLAGIDDADNCTLPAKFGSVIYTHSKPVDFYEHSEDSMIRDSAKDNFDATQLEALQRLFLYKNAGWGYEEEVRAVKTISSIQQSGGRYLIKKEIDPATCRETEVQTKTILLPIQPEAIKSIHFGIRCQTDCKDVDESLAPLELLRRTQNILPNAKLFGCGFQSNHWGMEEEFIGNIDEYFSKYYL